MEENKDLIEVVYDWIIKENLFDKYEKICHMPLGWEKADAKDKFWEGITEDAYDNYSYVVTTYYDDEEEVRRELGDEEAEEEFERRNRESFEDDLLPAVKVYLEQEIDMRLKRLRLHYPECFEKEEVKRDKEWKIKLVTYMFYFTENLFYKDTFNLALKWVLQLIDNDEITRSEYEIIPKVTDPVKLRYTLFRIYKERLLFSQKTKGGREALARFLANNFVDFKNDYKNTYAHLNRVDANCKEEFDQYRDDFDK